MSDSPIYVLGNLQPTFDPDSAVSAGTNLTAGAAPSLPHAIVVGPLLASIALGAVVGNALVVLSMLTNPKLRTITNRFVASLACADLSVGVLVMPLAIKVELTGTWRLGRTLCDVWTSFDVLLCTASILNLCAISVDRYVAVTRPLQTFTGSWRHRRVANAMITGAWLLAVVITCPPLFGWREPNRHVGDVCTLTQDPGYVVYSALGSFYVPMVIHRLKARTLCCVLCIFRCYEVVLRGFRTWGVGTRWGCQTQIQEVSDSFPGSNAKNTGKKQSKRIYTRKRKMKLKCYIFQNIRTNTDMYTLKNTVI